MSIRRLAGGLGVMWSRQWAIGSRPAPRARHPRAGFRFFRRQAVTFKMAVRKLAAGLLADVAGSDAVESDAVELDEVEFKALERW